MRVNPEDFCDSELIFRERPPSLGFGVAGCAAVSSFYFVEEEPGQRR